MKYDSITEEPVRALVERFYARIRQDDVLGPIFARQPQLNQAVAWSRQSDPALAWRSLDRRQYSAGHRKSGVLP
jgi:hypothetical protein